MSLCFLESLIQPSLICRTRKCLLCRVERESEGWREGPLERKTTEYRPLGPFVNTADLLCGLTLDIH